jgi:hypothetical protein
MANPVEGQVEFQAGGETYTLELTTRAERALQKKMKRPMGKLIEALSEGDVDALIAIFHAAFEKHHPKVTEDEAMDLVRPMQLRDLVSELLKVTYPADDVDPPKPDQTVETGSAN